MTYESIDLQVTEGLAHVVLNQPSLGNPFNEIFCREWGTLVNELSTRSGIRAVLISANGRFFSVGGDIGMFSRHLDELPVKIKDWTIGLHMGIARLSRLNAPIVAVVQGTAMGGAVGLLAGCDLVYSARSASFGAAYSSIGYSIDAGSSYTLAARMGLARARRFVLLSEMLKADQAEAVGLVDFVIDDDALFAEAKQAATRLAQGPTRAYGEVRRLFRKSFNQPFEAQLEDEAQALSMIAGSPDAREGILAFVEKRKPKFTGN